MFVASCDGGYAVRSWSAITSFDRVAFERAMSRYDLEQLQVTWLDSALPHADVGGAVATIRSSRAHRGTVLAFEFLVLTASRSGEVRGALWTEVDQDAATWTIPAGRMKARLEHRVPLSQRALEILDEALPLADESGLVFPSPTGRMLSDATMSKLLREQGVAAVPHGFRSSFRDWAAECSDAPREVCEIALAHVNSDRVEAPTGARICSSAAASSWRNGPPTSRDSAIRATRQPKPNSPRPAFTPLSARPRAQGGRFLTTDRSPAKPSLGPSGFHPFAGARSPRSTSRPHRTSNFRPIHTYEYFYPAIVKTAAVLATYHLKIARSQAHHDLPQPMNLRPRPGFSLAASRPARIIHRCQDVASPARMQPVFHGRQLATDASGRNHVL